MENFGISVLIQNKKNLFIQLKMCISYCMGRRCSLTIMQGSLIYVAILYLVNPNQRWLKMLLFKNGTILDLFHDGDHHQQQQQLHNLIKLPQSLFDVGPNNNYTTIKPSFIDDDYDDQSWYRTCCYVMVIIHSFGLIAILCKLWIGIIIYLIPNCAYFFLAIIQLVTTKNMIYLIDIIISFLIVWKCLMIILIECADNICNHFITAFRSCCCCCCSCFGDGDNDDDDEQPIKIPIDLLSASYFIDEYQPEQQPKQQQQILFV